MVKSVRFKNIVIFSMSIFPFFGSSVFGMKRFCNLFCCYGLKKFVLLLRLIKNPEKYLGGVDINELPYDCMTEVISFLKQKEALGLRSVNKLFAKSVGISPIEILIKLKGKKEIQSFAKSFLCRNLENKKLKKNYAFCSSDEDFDFVQDFIASNNPKKLAIVFDVYLNKHNSKKKFIIDFFRIIFKNKRTLSFGNFNLKKLKVENCTFFGSKKVIFPFGLKELRIVDCDNFGKEEFVLPSSLELFKVILCDDFGSKKIVLPSSLKHLHVSGSNSFGSKEIIFPSSLEFFKVARGRFFGSKKIVFPSKLKDLEVDGSDNFGEKEIVFPPLLKRLSVSFCKKFGFNKVVFPPLLKELKVFRSESFGSKEIVFPRGLKNLGVYNCESFGKNKIVYPVSLKYLDVRVD